MSKQNLTPEEWQAYLDRRNRVEATALKVCGRVLMAFAFLRAVFGAEMLTPVHIPWTGSAMLLAAGTIYELYIVIRAYLEKEDMRARELQTMAAAILGVLCFSVCMGRYDIVVPVFVVNVLTFIIGVEMKDAGKQRIKESKKGGG